MTPGNSKRHIRQTSQTERDDPARPEELLYDAERDLLAIAKFLVSENYRRCGLEYGYEIQVPRFCENSWLGITGKEISTCRCNSSSSDCRFIEFFR